MQTSDARAGAGPLGRRIRAWGRGLVRGRSGRLREGCFEVPDWDCYRMDVRHPFARLEPPDRERRLVDAALRALVHSGILPHADVDEQRYLALRRTLQAQFEIPWSAISPRVARLLYAINAIHRPRTLVAAGVFCGFTFICNAGAAVGPGRCYDADELVGIEIDPAEAARAERNVRRIDATGTARIVADDAVAWCARHAGPIDLLYLDADEGGRDGKSIYARITEAAWDRLPRGALLVAHNSLNSRGPLADYLAFVRSKAHCRASVNVALDWEGLEVSLK